MIKLSNKTILVLIIVIAAILRFFNYAEIPFTHDELSALSRVSYESFSTLIKEGVMPDGHPAGIQVFLYYWVRLFGTMEWMVKLPFTILGLLSVWLVYLIGSRWFNETTGLLSAAFFATIQYTVMYSQMARPYSSGLFFVLLMVYYWSRLVQDPEKDFTRNSVFFVISASLCTYNHHFSLLFAFIVGISGLFMVRREYRIRYILAGVAIFLLYIPHLKIFFHQLSTGGVEGWLAKPRSDFFFSYIGYIFNFSTLSLLVVILLALYGAMGRNRAVIKPKHYLLFFSWFMIPLLSGFFYSLYVNAVLQFSVLIFSFSFLLFLLFGHIRPQSPIINLLLVTALLAANTFSLVFTRDHYKLFYQSPYEALLVDYREAGGKENGTLSLMDSHHRNTAYFCDKLGVDTTGFTWFDSFKDEHELKCFLEKQSSMYPKLYLGSLSTINPRANPLIRDYYPGIEWRRDYAGATSYLFSRESRQEDEVMTYLDFESLDQGEWKSLDPAKYVDSVSFSGAYAYLIDEATQYGPGYSIKLEDLDWNENDFIEISARVRGQFQSGGQILVASLESGGDNIYWGGTPFENFAPCTAPENQWITVHHVLKLSDIHLNHPDLLLKVYPWNRGGASFLMDDFQISIRPGNPVIYGLTEDF